MSQKTYFVNLSIPVEIEEVEAESESEAREKAIALVKEDPGRYIDFENMNPRDVATAWDADNPLDDSGDDSDDDPD